MLKILVKIFPLFDYLYLFQLLEYNQYDFLRWFIKHPLNRDLQKKHRLQFTKKARLLVFFTIALMIGLVLITSILFLKNILLTFIFLLILQPLSPILLLLASLVYSPLDYYFKKSVIKKAQVKLQSLPHLRIVAITGSFGKTSTKEMLYTLLCSKYRTVRTPKSFNTPLGLAKTVLEDLKENTQVFIAEIGAYKKGEIAKITQFIRPQIGIITAVAPQHLERFGTLENIALAKFELAENLPKDGLLILNGESPKLVDMAPQAPSKVIFYGQLSYPFSASQIRVSTHGTSFKLHTPKGTVKITLKVIGEHHVKNFLAAAAVSLECGLTLDTLQKRAALILPTPHRLEIQKKDNWTIIDNTYNTNPQSAQASLKLLKMMPGQQKIVITPGLVELGKESASENQIFAKKMTEVADLIVIVGENAKKDLLIGLKEAHFSQKKIFLSSSLEEAIKILPQIALPSAVILLENDLPDQYL